MNIRIKKCLSIIALLVFFSGAFSLWSAGYSAGFSFGSSYLSNKGFEESSDLDFDQLFSAGINFNSEIMPLCFFADALFDFSKNGKDILKALEVSIDYHIASPVFKNTFIHYFYGPEFAAGFYGKYFVNVGLCAGLSYFLTYDLQLFIKAALRGGLEFNEGQSDFNLAIPLKAGFKFYF